MINDNLIKMPIIIDTDPGHDDAMAIMLAVNSGAFEIKAITTVAGNSTIENTTRNARYVLKLLEREDIPVYSGATRPLQRELIQAVVHGKSGLEGIDPQNEPQLTGDAVEKIISILDGAPAGTITLVTLGPLTNLAQAILTKPETVKRTKELVIMGGAIKVPGNKNRVAEFNFFVDPEAADIVMRFPLKKTLVPLDACNHVRMEFSEFEQIQDSKLREPLLAMVIPYIKNTGLNEGVKAALMYDPLTVYSLLNPNVCDKREYNLIVETKGEHTRGMSVAEMRLGKQEMPNVTVIEKISAEDFKRDFIACLSKSKFLSQSL